MATRDYQIKIKDKEIKLQISDLAEQADGSILVQTGDTVALITAVMAKGKTPDLGFFPLTVDYEERFYAAGKILGSRYMRREGRPSDEAIITARLIDRAIRPLFPKQFKQPVQVIATCLSWDSENDPDVISLIGASLALSLSPVPWAGPVGAVRIGKIDGNFVLNPTYEERKKSDLDFVLAGISRKGKLIANMIEAEGQETPDDVFVQAYQFATPYLLEIIALQEKIVQEHGATKAVLNGPMQDKELEQEIQDFAQEKLKTALFQGEKKTRMEAVNELKRELAFYIEGKYPGQEKDSYAKDFFESEIDRLVHEGALQEGKRVDDRKLDEVRDLSGIVGMLPRTHGSGLFVRGQTKTLSLLTLGAPGDQRLLEGMEFIGKKRFMHHYNFPPYAPGEVKPLRGPGRREIGHGMLAEKALLPTIPLVDEFPYTIRIVTECVSSNGSTSMASVCSSTLALMDAGVPIKRPAAGISMGLMQDDAGNYKILTDIQGPEDHHGDMDFKVAGTTQGITAIQLDVKVEGITEQIFIETLAQAKKVRETIINQVITKTIAEPRKELSQWAPRMASITINPGKIGLVIGPGGKMINKIIEETDTQIDIEDTGVVFITGEKQEGVQQALQIIQDLVREVEVGTIYQGKVKKIMDFGAFVEILPNQEGLVHISQLASGRVEKVTDILQVGDVIPVKVLKIDDLGRIDLSLKEAQQP